MLSYTVYSEAGGVGKSTLAANLSVAHARAGLDVLVIPLDYQDGDLSRLLGVDDQRSDPEADNLVRHLINAGKGEFTDLIRTVEDVDIIPEHNALADLKDHLDREQEKAETLGDAYNVHAQLLRVLQGADVQQHYDVVICDPPASEGYHLYNAIYATRNLVIPFEPSAKGRASIEGLQNLAGNFSDRLNIDVGVICAIPNGIKDTSSQQRALDGLDISAPETIRDRTALMEGCWERQCSAYRFEREYRDYPREYEVDTLAKLDRIARFLEDDAGINAPHSPDAGTLEEMA